MGAYGLQHRQTGYLDSIRGLAALTVLNEHFVIAYGLPCVSEQCKARLDASPLNVWWDGSAAVAMFFVLSGLVLSMKYADKSRHDNIEPFDLMAYVVGRFCRIALPYWVVLLCSGLAYFWVVREPMSQTLLAASDWITQMWHGHPLDHRAMLREAWLFGMPDTIVLLPQSWTLAIEISLSMLLPVGLILIRRGWLWLAFFSLFAVFALGVSPFLLHFVLGLSLAYNYSVWREYLQKHSALRILLVGVGVSLYATGTSAVHGLGSAWAWQSLGLGAALILLFALCSPTAQRVLSLSWLQFIGRISYSAYLVHMLILIGVTPWWLAKVQSLIGGGLGLWWCGWLGTVVLVQCAAWILYHAVEHPSISVGKYLVGAVRRLVPATRR
jgi:peptidoglycan/LPS O-acetylase OafA/YrhL